MLNIYFLNVNVLNDEAVFLYYYENLSLYRRAKIDRFFRREDKNLSLGVGILTDIFLKKLGLREKNMQYCENKSGKPYFKNSSDIFFNLSHSGAWAMGAFSDSEVGCDIEVNCKPKETIASLVLSEEENSSNIINTWTRKESYLKFRGCGLEVPMNSFTANDINIIRELNVIDGYCASVCSVERDLHYCHIIKLSCTVGEPEAFRDYIIRLEDSVSY